VGAVSIDADHGQLALVAEGNDLGEAAAEDDGDIVAGLVDAGVERPGVTVGTAGPVAAPLASQGFLSASETAKAGEDTEDDKALEHGCSPEPDVNR